MHIVRVFVMMNADDLQSGLLNQRVEDAVDVPGVFDNCFFHSVAAHLLANKLPLPTDLFTPNSKNAGSPAEQLKETFTSTADLEMFNSYQKQRFPGAEDSEMLAEKVLVLGVLYREWFAAQLLKDHAHRDELFDNNDVTKVSFLKLINACREVGLETALHDDRMAPIYEANRDFFDNLHHNPQLDEKQAFRTYWEEQGYNNYCQHLASPNVKVTFAEFDPVLKAQNVPYTLYSKQDGSITAQNAGDINQPHFELAIAEKAGHYTLLKNAQTQDALNEFAASLDQYKADREALLSMSGTQAEKREASRNMTSPLVVAICPNGEVANNQIQALVARVAEIKAQISEERLDNGNQTLPSLAQDEQLTSKEQHVLDATTTHNQHSDAKKAQAYKEEVKRLLIAGRKGFFAKDSTDNISPDEIEGAEALEGETDEDFAKRLQDTEFKGAGLK